MSSSNEPAFAEVLSQAIQSRGLSLERIRHRLDEMDVQVSVATLSYWKNGRSQPLRARSARTLAALEEVLGLEAGRLVSAAPVSGTRRRSGNGPEPLRLPEAVERALDDLGLRRDGLRTTTTHLSARVDGQGFLRTEVVRRVMQCAVDGTDRFPVLVGLGEVEGSAGAGPTHEVVALGNCSVGRSMEVWQAGVAVAELLLPRALRRGDLVMVEYESRVPGRPVVGDRVVVPVSHVGEVVVEVRFDGQWLPGRVVAWTAESGLAPEEAAVDVAELPLTGGRAQLVRLDLPPCLCVVQWHHAAGDRRRP